MAPWLSLGTLPALRLCTILRSAWLCRGGPLGTGPWILTHALKSAGCVTLDKLLSLAPVSLYKMKGVQGVWTGSEVPNPSPSRGQTGHVSERSGAAGPAVTWGPARGSLWSLLSVSAAMKECALAVTLLMVREAGNTGFDVLSSDVSMLVTDSR